MIYKHFAGQASELGYIYGSLFSGDAGQIGEMIGSVGSQKVVDGAVMLDHFASKTKIYYFVGGLSLTVWL